MTQRNQGRSQKCSRCSQWDKDYFLHDWEGEKLCDDCFDKASDEDNNYDTTQGLPK